MLLEEGGMLGWRRDEMLEALIEVAKAMQLADQPNDLVEEALGRALLSQRH